MVKGRPIDPLNEYGHDVLWWLDRMVRTTWPLQEKLTLFWHDHFATRDQDTPLMLRQNRMLRQHGMGSFRRLLRQVLAQRRCIARRETPVRLPREPSSADARIAAMRPRTCGS